MTELIRVFNGSLSPSTQPTTNIFTNGLFGFVKTNQPSNIRYDFGIGLGVLIPTGTSVEEKEIPLKFEEDNVINTFQTFRIPLEYAFTPYECYLVFNSLIDIPNLEVFIVRSGVTLETISEDIESLQGSVDQQALLENAFNTAIAFNQIQQNASLALYNLALAPITGGASTALLPGLGQSTAALSAVQLLLTGG